MNHRTWPVLLLAAGGWIGIGGPVGAQTLPPGGEPSTPSHLPISEGPFDPQAAEEMLARRLRKLKDGGEHDALKKLVEDLLKDEAFKKKLSDPKFLEELQKKAKTDPGALANDARFKPLLDKIRDNPELQKEFQKGTGSPSPELLEDLKKKVMEKLQPGAESGSPPKQGASPERPFDQPPPKGSSSSPPTQPRPETVPPAQRPSTAQPQATPHIESSSWINRQLKGLTQGLMKQVGDPKNSPWLRDLFKNVLDHKPGEGGWMNEASGANEWARRLEGLKDYLPRVGGLFDRLGSPFRHWRLPSIGGNWSSVSFVPSLPSPPSMPAGGGVPAARGGLTVLWLVFLAVAALLVWKVIGRQRERVTAAKARQQWLGPWPVSPAAVRTREELVRAFDYLALLVLGPPARTCHHLDVAGQLGRQPDLDADRRREAAGHLARVYEKARYAPGDEPLPDEELAVARRELCLLAGVAGA